MLEKLLMTDINPVFIVGHPYSGTTFLQLLLTAHPGFTSGPETHYFHYVLKPLKNWMHSPLSTDQLHLVFKRFSETPKIQFEKSFIDRMGRISEPDGISAASLLNEIMLYFAAKTGGSAERWVEKTPKHGRFINEIFNLFPNAFVLNLLRDPRDVVSSALRRKTLKSDAERKPYCIKRAKKWKREVGNILKIAPSFPRLRTVRYDDIVANPPKMVQEIMDFLGEKYRPEVLETFSENYESVTVPSENGHKYLASKKAVIDRRGIWKTRMSEEDAVAVEKVCYDLMIRCGYAVSDTAKPSRAKKAIKRLVRKFRFNRLF